MWNVKKKKHVIPVIGATGTVSKSFRKYLSNIPGKQEIKTAENSHIGHCIHTSESTNVKDLPLEVALHAP
jgi:hypothetical protein